MKPEPTTAAIFEITDGDITFNLFDLNPVDFTDKLPTWKGGGVWQTSPFDNGEVLVTRQLSNVSDTFIFNPSQPSQDLLIAKLRGLVGLLEKAVAFGTSDWQVEPVWIKMRGACETNTYYAIIRGYTLPELADPTFDPYAKGSLENITLVLSHDLWQDVEPQTASCVAVSGQQLYQGAQSADSFYGQAPEYVAGYAAGGDVVTTLTAIAVSTSFGVDANGLRKSTAIKFYVNIPRGSRVTVASLLVKASSNQAGVNVLLNVSAERNAPDTLPLFGISYYNMLYNRPRLSTVVAATINAAWVLNNTYSIAGLNYLIEEAIGQPEWTGEGYITLYIEDNGSAVGVFRDIWSYSGGYSTQLNLTWFPNNDLRGREETCEEVVVANKHNRAQITHMFYYDSGAAHFDADIVSNPWPAPVLISDPGGPPNSVTVGDFWYFGCQNDSRQCGPFSSATLDIQIPQNLPLTLTLEFWDGVTAAWVLFPVTAWYDGTIGFSRPGVRTISWITPGATGYAGGAYWLTRVVNGINGWWVRLGVSAVPAVTNDMYLWNRAPYTCCWAFVDVASDQVRGDVAAIAKSYVRGLTHLGSNWKYNSLYLAVRSLSRGTDFSPYINFRDPAPVTPFAQNPIGITIAASVASTVLQYMDNIMPFGSANGYVALFTPVGPAPDYGGVVITFDYGIAPQYCGKYAVYLRYAQVGGVNGDFTAMLSVVFGLGSYATKTVAMPSTGNVVLIDYIDLGSNVAKDEMMSQCTIDVFITALGVAGVMYLYDLILVPVDEYAVLVDIGAWNIDNLPYYSDLAVIDSIELRKRGARAYLYQTAPLTPAIVKREPFYLEGSWKLQANTDQRIWYFALHNLHMVISEQHWANRQYLLNRGDS